MKLPVRIALILLCAALIAVLPFVVSSPNMLNDVKMELMNEGEEEIDFGRLLFSSAMAEDDLDVEELEDGQFASHPEWALPLDFTPGREPNPELYTEDGYEDETIRVKLEHRDLEDGTKVHIAYVQISDPSQLRTGVARPESLGSNKTQSIGAFAKQYNAVIAINGDYFVDKPDSKPLVYRMTQKIRNKMKSDKKDALIIDDQGDFHLSVHSLQEVKDISEKLKQEGRKLVNAYSFGPTLVRDGEMIKLRDDYQFNPSRKNPRTAIGQLGRLSYVMVIVEAQDRDGHTGMTQQQLAELMHSLGCVHAYNLDGGNSSEMVFGKQTFKGQAGGDDRGVNDVIYFATMQP